MLFFSSVFLLQIPPSNMGDDNYDYINDPRKICKYGNVCYQKNSTHHSLYKHPPLIIEETIREKRTKNRVCPYSRNKKQINKDSEQESSKQLEESSTNCNHNVVNENIAKDSEPDEVKDGEVLKTDPSESKSPEQKHKPSSIILEENLATYDPSTSLSVLKELFLVEMPSDFYKLYEFLNVDNSFEMTLSRVNLEPIGPYDLLLGKLPVLDNKELYLTHWRFFYDPPEFQAVLKKKGSSEYHIGYFRDEPSEKPVFLACNDSAKDYHITPLADNIFGALYLYLENQKKTSLLTAQMSQILMDRIKEYAEENDYSLAQFNTKKRLANVVTKTFHGAGIVVPYDKKTKLGYRRLVEIDANIKKLFNKLKAAKTESEKDSVLSELQPIITYATIAVDECDFGTGLEVGIDLFCSGLKELEPPALSSLTAAYSLLNREEFSKIIQAHLNLRRRGPDMSILSLQRKSPITNKNFRFRKC